MAKLTQAQIDAAKQAWFERGTSQLEDRFVVIAPLLQLPREPITDDEWDFVCAFVGNNRDSFDALIARRNAALLPKPVDSRVATVADALATMAFSEAELTDRYLAMAIRVLAALDGKVK